MASALDPNEVLCSTDAKANFQRLARLLISGGTTLLKEIFDQQCPPSNLPTILQNPATKKLLAAARLTKPQWDCLYPSPGVCGKSEDFDVTLLFRLLRTICNLTPPATGWDALPASTDHSLAADLARIKYYRNSVYGHVNRNMETTDAEFPWLWQEISEALVRIAGQISSAKKTRWQAAIASFLTNPLTTEDERNVQELEWWYKNDMDLKDFMEEVREGMRSIRDELRTTPSERMERLEKCPTGGENPCRPLESFKDTSTDTSALLQITIDCTEIIVKGEGDIPTRQQVLDLVATLYLKEIEPSTLEEFNGFVDYMEKVRKVLIIDTHSGSLIITVKCRSLQILEELWNDYCIGRVDEMAQKFLVTEEVLNDLNLAKAKLVTTIPKGEYEACREKLLMYSDTSSRDQLRELEERLKKQRDESQNKFLRWAHNRRQTRAFLTEFVTKLGGSIVGSIGLGVMAFTAGVLAAPFTFGTSLAFGAAAVATAGAAGAAGAVMNTWDAQNKALKVIDQDERACQELDENIGPLEQCITDFAVFCRGHADLVLSSELVNEEFGFLLDTVRSADRKEMQEAKPYVPSPTALATFLQESNAYFRRVTTFRQELRGYLPIRDVSMAIQQIQVELRECPGDEEIKTMIENFIKERFKYFFDM